jgi:hypothetical protein
MLASHDRVIGFGEHCKGHMTDEDLDRELTELEETRKSAEHELVIVKNRQERKELLKRGKDEILNTYARMTPEILDVLVPEERHRLYQMLRLNALINSYRSLEVNGALVTKPVQSEFMQPGKVLR